MQRALVWAVAAAVGWAVTAGASSAQAQWGAVKGQVVLDGAIPELKLLVKKGDTTAKDAAVCAAQDVPDESLIVDPATKGIANVVVFLKKKPEKIHPSLQKPAAMEVVYDQMGCKFVPHVAVVRTDQAVRVISADAVSHNTRGNPLKNQAFNFIVSPNSRDGILVPMKVAERLPVEVKCDIHPWMQGWWLVIDHPYGTVTDAAGKFEIADLPPGEHEFVVWHERPGYVQKSLKVNVKAGEATAVPVIKAPAATMAKK